MPGMSPDNVRGWDIVRKMNIWPRSEASRANVKFWGQSLSQGHYQPTYQRARKGFIYFITLPLIFCIFCWLFCTYRNSTGDQVFLMSLSADSRILPWKMIKMKRWNSRAGFTLFSFVSFWQKQSQGNYRRRPRLLRDNCPVILHHVT